MARMEMDFDYQQWLWLQNFLLQGSGHKHAFHQP